MRKPRVGEIATKAKNHVKNHKFAYVMGAVAIAAVAGNQRNIKGFTKFMEEKGIDPDEFFCPEYFEEKQQSNA